MSFSIDCSIFTDALSSRNYKPLGLHRRQGNIDFLAPPNPEPVQGRLSFVYVSLIRITGRSETKVLGSPLANPILSNWMIPDQPRAMNSGSSSGNFHCGVGVAYWRETDTLINGSICVQTTEGFHSLEGISRLSLHRRIEYLKFFFPRLGLAILLCRENC